MPRQGLSDLTPSCQRQKETAFRLVEPEPEPEQHRHRRRVSVPLQEQHSQVLSEHRPEPVHSR